VVIDVAGDRLITLSAAQAVRSFTSNERVDVVETLVVSTTAQVGNNLRLLGGGTLRGGNYTLTGGASLLVANGGLDAVTLQGDLSLPYQNPVLTVTNGLTLNGTAHLNGDGQPTIIFSGTQAVAGNATFSFDAPSTTFLALSGAGTTLTLGSGVIVHGGQGWIGSTIVASDGDRTLVNQGLIAADVSGQSIQVNGSSRPLNVINSGTLRATGGGLLDVTVASLVNSGTLEASGPGSFVNIAASGWSNTGTIKASGGGAIYLGGEFTFGPTSVLATAGGAVRIIGTLHDSTVALNAASGSWGLAGGTIRNSTINLSQGAVVDVSQSPNNRFDASTINGDVSLISPNSSLLVSGGLTLNGTAHLGGDQTNITFDATQTLKGNATLALEGPASGALLGLAGNGTTLTLGPAVTVHGVGRIGTTGIDGLTTRTIINQGVISSDVSGGTLRFGNDNAPFAVKNTGTLRATNGATLQLSVNSLVNTGTLEAIAGAIVNVEASEAINDGLLRIDGGTVQVMGGDKLVTTPTSNTILSADLGRLILWRGFNNGGSFTWSGGAIAGNGGKLIAPDSGVFNNLAGAVFNVSAAGSFFNVIGSSGNAFINAGDFSKTSSTITIFDVPFTNLPGGSVKVNDGTLVLSGGGMNQGTITVSKGATARFAANFTHAAGSTLIAQGDVAFDTAVFNLDGNLFIDGELSFSSASATIKGGTTATKLAIVNSTASVAAGGSLQVNGGGINFGGSTGNTITLQPSATAPGKLLLAGDVSFTGSDGTSGLNTSDISTGQTAGLLDLGGGPRRFTINDGLAAIDLAVSAHITNGSIIKSGAGTLRLDSPNAYTGGTTVSAGTLEVIDPTSLGTGNVTVSDATLSLKSDAAAPPAFAANVIVNGDATIRVDRISVGATGTLKLGNLTIGGTRLAVTGANRSLEIAGLMLAAANPTLDVSAPLTINGPITQTAAGAGFTKSTGTAKITFGGATANTYTGLTRVNAGSLELSKPAGVLAVPGDLQVFGGSVKALTDGQIATTANVTIANAGSLLDLAGHPQTFASLSITGNGAVTVGATTAGAPPLRINGAFTVTTGGKLDLANNKLIVDYDPATGTPTPIASIRAALASAYASGAWTGPGVGSAGIAANRSLGYAEAAEALGPSGGSFGGTNVDGTTVLVGYTLSGDANLDGSVNFLDLAKLAQSYNTTVTSSSTWYRGDFNYDGTVDFLDLANLAQNYNTSLSGAPIAGASADFQGDLARAFASVPEPSALVLFGLTVLVGRGRPRRFKAELR
jgi:fibronectin-binding autotransporter adhesin